jgi:hypothetical protein
MSVAPSEDAMAYAARVALLACPFCREMFEEGEAKACPLCGMALTPFDKLPPSHDAHAEDGVPTMPETEKLPVTYLGRGKGPLAAIAVLGLPLFFLPWIYLKIPYDQDLSAYDLSRHRLGWLWAVAVAWTVLLPTVLSRRSIVQMRGARVAAAFLAAIPAISTLILLAKPPHGALFTVKFTYGMPLFATLFLSLVGIFFALRLGGSVDDIKVVRGSSKGQTLH